MLYLLRLILVLMLLLPASVFAADELEINVQQVMEQAKKHAATLDLQINKHREAGMKAAQESARIFHSTDFQEKLRCEAKRIEKEVFLDDTEGGGEEIPRIPGKLAADEKLYLFFHHLCPMQRFIPI